MSTMDVIHFAFWFTVTFVAVRSSIKVVAMILYNWLTTIERKLERKVRREQGPMELDKLASELEGKPGVTIGMK